MAGAASEPPPAPAAHADRSGVLAARIAERSDMSLIAIVVYSSTTVLISGVLFWRYTREPEKGKLFLGLFALWLAVPIVVWALPAGWVPTATRGHPSWLGVLALALLIGGLSFEFPETTVRLALVRLFLGPPHHGARRAANRLPARLAAMTHDIASGAVQVYYLFDVADTIDLAKMSALAGDNRAPAALPLRPHAQPYLQFPVPPLVARLPEVEFDGLSCSTRLKFYDYGVVSLRFSFHVAGTWDDLSTLTDRVRSDERIVRFAESTVTRICDEYGHARTNATRR